MTKQRYDPLIFGSVEIADQVVKCKGKMCYRAHSCDYTTVMLQCTTCAAIMYISSMSYELWKYDRSTECGAICQEQ